MMSHKQELPIVMQGLPKWDAEYQSTAFHIAKGLSRRRPVFYVEHPFTWKDRLATTSAEAVAKRSGKRCEQPFAQFPNLHVIYPGIVPPINFLAEGRLFEIARNRTNNAIWRRVAQVLNRHGVSEFIYINSFDPIYCIPDTARQPVMSIYHCVDWMAGEPYIARHGVRAEEEMMRNSDLVVTTSRPLRHYAMYHNTNAHYIGNAADPGHFQSGRHPAPEAYRGLDGPIVLYLGSVGTRLDTELIIRTAQHRPGWHFCFVGPISGGKEQQLAPVPNIHLTGPRPYESVPAYMQHADLCWIPFRQNELTRHIYPLKLNEYLACGKPVVATDFTDLSDFERVVTTINNPRCAAHALESALITDNLYLKNQRTWQASQNTWNHRIEAWEALLANELPVNRASKAS